MVQFVAQCMNNCGTMPHWAGSFHCQVTQYAWHTGRVLSRTTPKILFGWMVLNQIAPPPTPHVWTASCSPLERIGKFYKVQLSGWERQALGVLTMSMSGKVPVFFFEKRRFPFTVTSKSPAHNTAHHSTSHHITSQKIPKSSQKRLISSLVWLHTEGAVASYIIYLEDSDWWTRSTSLF